MSTVNPIPVWPTGSPRATQLEAMLADAADRLLEIAEEAERRTYGTPLYLKREYHAFAGAIARQCVDLRVVPLGLGGRNCKRLAKYMADVEANKERCARRTAKAESSECTQPK